MQIKVLVVGIIKKGNQILLRKKPVGSPPYQQSWYLFSAELNGDKTAEETIKEGVKKQAGIDIKMLKELTWDTEVKKDHDGEIKNFIYLDAECEYLAGDLQIGEGIEKLEWADVNKLDQYDHVPPSQILLKKLGYLV